MKSFINNGDSGTSFAVPTMESAWDFEEPDRNYTRAFSLRAKTADLSGDVVFIFGGTNDYGKGVALGDKNSTDPTTFFGAVRDTVETVLARNPSAKIILATPLQRELILDLEGMEKNKAGHTLEEYVNAIKSIGEKYNLLVLDLYHNGPVSIDNLDEKTGVLKYTYDGLHLNNEGGRATGQVIGEFILEQLEIEL